MKKLFFLLILLLNTMILASCVNVINDPFKVAEIFDDEGYSVSIIVDRDDINEMRNTVGITGKKISHVLYITKNGIGINHTNSDGAFIYFENDNAAKESKTIFEEYMLSHNIKKEIVKSSENVVFIGSEELWNIFEYESRQPLIDISVNGS